MNIISQVACSGVAAQPHSPLVLLTLLLLILPFGMVAFATGAAFAAEASAGTLPPSAAVPPTLAEPVEGDTWIRPGEGTAAKPIWGIRGGIWIALWPTDGPRGLIRIYTPYLDQRPGIIMNYIAVEPVCGGNRGYSEMETSAWDNAQGRLMWTDNDGSGAPALPWQPAPGVEETVDGVRALSFFVHTEPFANGARVKVKILLREDRPYEIGLASFSETGSAAMEKCILTATMGNYARLRTLHLKDGTVNVRDIFAARPPRENAFTDHAFFPLAQLRVSCGDAIIAAAPDEAAPVNVAYEPGGWQYEGKVATQYWIAPVADNLAAAINARSTYWLGVSHIPGGMAIENFELVTDFREGQYFRFGITPEPPARRSRGMTGLRGAVRGSTGRTSEATISAVFFWHGLDMRDVVRYNSAKHITGAMAMVLVSAKPKTEQLADFLREELRRGISAPGGKLPSTRVLARRFGVSQIVARNAFVRLEREGLLESRRGSGTYIREMIPAGKSIAILNELDISHHNASYFYIRVIQQLRLFFEARQIPVKLYLGHQAPNLPPCNLPLAKDALMEDVKRGIVAGIVALSGLTTEAWRRPLASSGLPLVGTDSYFPCGFDMASEDMIRAGFDLLLAQHCRTPWIVTNSDTAPPHFRDLCRGRGISVPPSFTDNHGMPSPQPGRHGFGYEMVMRLLGGQSTDQPDGLLFTDDILFRDAMMAILELGIKVPESLRIVTHANRGSGMFIPFPVTLLEYNPDEIAQRFGGMLLGMLDGKERAPGRIPAPFKVMAGDRPERQETQETMAKGQETAVHQPVEQAG